jgi:hypothetical protein
MSVANLYCWGENFVPVLLLLLSPSPRKNLEPQRRARATLHIFSHASHAAMTTASGDAATSNTPANPAVTQDAIPGILNDIVVTHVLRPEYFEGPRRSRTAPCGEPRDERRGGGDGASV